MLRHTGPAANPIIEKLVDELIREDLRMEQSDRRSINREPFARPVIVRVNGRDEPYHGFTKNISAHGIGIISHEPFPEQTNGKIEIHSLGAKKPVIMSELRWCKPFGENWYLSGWKFATALRS